MTPPAKSPGSGEKSRNQNAYRAAFEQATQIASSAETLERCAEVEAAVEALRVRYEQYFLGLTRTPPLDDHKLVRSAVLRLRQAFVRNTSARFRVQSLHNRFLSYERLWQRTVREIEEGTYRRDLFKAKLRRKERESQDDRRAAETLDTFRHRLAEKPLPEGDDDFEVDEEVPEPAPPPRAVRPAVQPAPPPPAAAAPVLEEAKLRALYEAYVGAKRRLRESTEGLTYEAVANSLRRQVPEILATHQAKSVDFKVVIKGGKAVLKAVPR